MHIDEVVEQMLNDPGVAANVAAYREMPERAACYTEFPPSIHPSVRTALIRRGIERLYSHQAQAVETVLRGESVVVVTPTASGKTLCYNVPALDSILRDESARALYLFPTKAL